MNHEKVAIPQIEVPKGGFIYVFLTNESDSPNPVYFDDMEVVVEEHPVIQRDDYYPFGLTFNSWQRSATNKINDFKYNVFEDQTELDWNVYDYQARYYDPAIGRFLNVDPAADLMRRHSPYNYAFDNPIRFIDPDGMMPTESTGCPDGNCDPKPMKDKNDGQVTYLMPEVEFTAEQSDSNDQNNKELTEANDPFGYGVVLSGIGNGEDSREGKPQGEEIDVEKLQGGGLSGEKANSKSGKIGAAAAAKWILDKFNFFDNSGTEMNNSETESTPKERYPIDTAVSRKHIGRIHIGGDKFTIGDPDDSVNVYTIHFDNGDSMVLQNYQIDK